MNKFIRYILAIIFLSSGILKLINNAHFIELLQNNYKFSLYFSTIISLIINPLEVLIGLFFLSNKFNKKIGWFVISFILILTLFYVYSYFMYNNVDCGCFGEILKINPITSIIKNIFILVCCYYLLYDYNEKNITNKYNIYIFIIVLIAGIINGYTSKKSIIQESQSLKISKGNDTQNSILSKVINPSIYNKKVGIFIYSPTCKHCWNVTLNIKDLIYKKKIDTLIGITLQNYINDTSAYNQYFMPNFKTICISQNDMFSITNFFPLLIIIKDNLIQEIYKKDEIPNGMSINF